VVDDGLRAIDGASGDPVVGSDDRDRVRWGPVDRAVSWWDTTSSVSTVRSKRRGKLTSTADSAMIDDEAAAEVSVRRAPHRRLVWELSGSGGLATDNASTPLLELLRVDDIGRGDGARNQS
jgi:hypothetical protein